ncbi:MAG: sugar ABC transporter permease [Chloroflexota bacterium]
MSEAPASPPDQPARNEQPEPQPAGGGTLDEYRRKGGALFRSTEVDARLLGLMIALGVVWILFDIASGIFGQGGSSLFGGSFLTPRNLFNLSVQTSSIAVMATGMVLIIVSRNIDLSVGSLLGFLAMVMAIVQKEILPDIIGFDNSITWIIALVVGISLGALIGAGQGFAIAFLGVPSFIVTLGGLLVWRGGAFLLASGRTIAPLDSTFSKIGGGTEGSLGRLGVDLGVGSETLSWMIGIGVLLILAGLIIYARRRRRAFGFPTRPAWAEALLIGGGAVLVLGSVWVVNSYPWPIRVAERYAEANGLNIPEGGLILATGIAFPVLIMLGVAAVMTFLARRRQFGRYVFAIGGNPEAAELSGINVRWTIVKVFLLMGVLVAISAAITSGRLDAATNSLGVLNELFVIAAAVIGGSSFSGGIGTIPGAILGALFMQTLQSGMVLLGFDTASQQVVIGIVLVVAVGIDTAYRKRSET